MPKFFEKVNKKSNDNAKKPKKTPEERIKRYQELIRHYEGLIDGLRDKITEDEGILDLMCDMPECTDDDRMERQTMIFKNLAELDQARRNKKRYEQKMKLIVIPIAMKPIEIEDDDDDVIILDVIDLTKDE